VLPCFFIAKSFANHLATEDKYNVWIGITLGNKAMSYYKLRIYDSAMVNLKINMQYCLKVKEYGTAKESYTRLGV